MPCSLPPIGRHSVGFLSIIYIHCGACSPETHIKRQVTWHDCLPSSLGVGDKWSEIVSGEEKIFCTRPTRATKAGQKYLLPARRAQRTNQGRTLFICTPRVPFSTVSTVSRGIPLYTLWCSLPAVLSVYLQTTACIVEYDCMEIHQSQCRNLSVSLSKIRLKSHRINYYNIATARGFLGPYLGHLYE
jgi:hypothetical protein